MITLLMEKRVEVIHREYWVCKNEKHRHQTEEVAAKCILNTKNGPKYPKWTKEQLEEIVSLRDSGMTFKELGKRFSRTPALMSQKYKSTCLYIKHQSGLWRTPLKSSK